jgi:transposase
MVNMSAAEQAKSDCMREVLKRHHVDGEGIRAIAKAMRISRKSVRRMLGHNPLTVKVRERRSSVLDPYRAEIAGLLEKTPAMKAPAVLERLRLQGYTGGITVLRDLLRVLRPTKAVDRRAFFSLDFMPGQKVQIDWGDFGFAIPGCPRRVSAFVMAMCYSRYLYIEFTLAQAMGTFLRCMERGLSFYGGRTTADVFDNMKTVVSERSKLGTVFNRRFLDYAAARGFAVEACNPASGWEKGRVERPIGFVRERFWPGRRFHSLTDLNRQAVEWRDSFCNGRIHDDTGKVPALVFEHEEKALLVAANTTPFDTDDVLSVGATKQFRVPFDRNTYTVPHRLVHQQMLVRANDDWVSIYLGPKCIAAHRRSWNSGEDIKHPSHEEGLLEQKPKAKAGGLPPGVVSMGDTGVRYFKHIGLTNRSIHRELVRMTMLCELFGALQVASAADEVMHTGHVGAEYVEFVLRHKRGLVPNAAPLRLGIAEYDSMSLGEPDLARFDSEATARLTLDPGIPLVTTMSTPEQPS